MSLHKPGAETWKQLQQSQRVFTSRWSRAGILQNGPDPCDRTVCPDPARDYVTATPLPTCQIAFSRDGGAKKGQSNEANNHEPCRDISSPPIKANTCRGGRVPRVVVFPNIMSSNHPLTSSQELTKKRFVVWKALPSASCINNLSRQPAKRTSEPAMIRSSHAFRSSPVLDPTLHVLGGGAAARGDERTSSRTAAGCDLHLGRWRGKGSPPRPQEDGVGATRLSGEEAMNFRHPEV